MREKPPGLGGKQAFSHLFWNFPHLANYLHVQVKMPVVTSSQNVEFWEQFYVCIKSFSTVNAFTAKEVLRFL